MDFLFVFGFFVQFLGNVAINYLFCDKISQVFCLNLHKIYKIYLFLLKFFDVQYLILRIYLDLHDLHRFQTF